VHFSAELVILLDLRINKMDEAHRVIYVPSKIRLCRISLSCDGRTFQVQAGFGFLPQNSGG